MRHLKFLLLLILLVGLTTVETAFATSWEIADEYIGTYNTYGGTSYSQRGGDVIAANDSEADKFDINYMTVDIDNQGEVTVRIATDYRPDIGGFGTNYGDLFISSNGSSDWQYVFDTSKKAFYATSEGEYRNSDYFFSANWDPNTYRSNHLVQFNPDGTAIKKGNFNRKKIGETRFLEYSGFNLADLGIDDPEETYNLAFRWTQTCGNDIIEGSISNPVPEPETMVMLGIGLLGLGALGRRKVSLARIRSKRRQS